MTVDAATVIAMLLAGLLHAAWHGVIKSSEDRLAAFAGMGLVSAAVALCFAPFVEFPSGSAWLILAVSVPLHIGYKLSLASAYRHGDLGQAFPLARGFVPLFATAIAALTLGQQPSVPELAGICLVSAGVLAMALDGQRRATSTRLFAAAAFAGLTVACYSVVDAYGTRIAPSWLSFTVWLIIADTLGFAALCWLLRGASLWPQLVSGARTAVVSGLLGCASFGVFLWALSRQPVGPVSALREASVMFAVLIGAAVWNEKPSPGRVGSVGLILGGIAVVTLGR